MSEVCYRAGEVLAKLLIALEAFRWVANYFPKADGKLRRDREFLKKYCDIQKMLGSLGLVGFVETSE